jgi:hypothetical protein
MPPLMAVDHWSGPGRSDTEIAPLRPQDNAVHLEDHKHAFEHWYFDARLDDGHVVVAMLQSRELVARKPGIELHVYKPDGERLEVVQRYPHAAVQASKERCDIRVGANHAWVEPDSLDGRLPVHRLVAEEGGIAFDLTFDSEVPSWKPGDGWTSYSDAEYFAWTVGAPRARVTGTIRYGTTELDVSGVGYHDHNWGVGDMKRIIDHWFWGRLYAEDFTLVYANVLVQRAYGATWSSPLMLAHEDEIVLSTGEVAIETGPPVWNEVANHTYPSYLRLSAGGGAVELKLTVQEIIHAHDLLSDVPVVRNVKPVVRKLVGSPGYFRFRSDYELRAVVDGELYERTGSTLHEMVALK